MPRIIAVLFFQSVAQSVYAARASFFYVLPAAACIFVGAWLWLAEIHFAAVAVFFIAAALACTQFVIATIRVMINPHYSATYPEAMRWTRASSDFFLFIALAFAAMGALSVFLLDSATLLYDYSMRVSDARVRRMAEGEFESAGMRTSFILVVFGSRALAAGALLLAAVLWSRLCRIGIQIPAHVEGYYLSAREAIEVTRGRGWHLTILSLIINGGLSALGGALLTGMESAFDGEVPNWANAAATAGGLWAFGLLNAGYWTAAYREFASGYVMRREIY